MLTIREAQMQVFRDKQLQVFARGRLSDLAARFPRKCEELGELEVKTLVNAGIDKSFRLGIVGEADVENIIDLMLLHGADFDSREEFAYEAEPLRDSEVPADARVPLTLARFGLKPGFREE